MKNKNTFIVFAILFVLAVLSRWVGHLWNFTVVGGAFLFAGAYFQDKKIAVALMLASMLASDALIGFHSQMPAVYLGYVAMVLVGFGLAQNNSRGRVAGFALLGSFLFFVISNFGVWIEGTLYPLTTGGLIDCYVMGLPFYKVQLASDLISGVLFFELAKLAGVYAVVKAKN